MKHLRLFAGFGLAAVLAGSVPFATTSASEPTDPGASKIAAAGQATARSGASLDWLPAGLDPSAPIKVIVTVTGESVAEAEGAELEAGTTFTAADEAAAEATARSAQSRVAGEIQSAGGEVQAQHVDAINAITAVVPAGELEALADSTDVVSISAVRTYTRDNGPSNAYTGVPAAWEAYGYTGAGVTIAVIDDGIDYTHADFGGSGDPAAYAVNDRTVIEGGTFPTTKVVGGYDFVGDDYDASSTDTALQVPAPDPDPLACGEHGTHVAGTAAGQGVSLDGTTYTGPYDTSVDPADFLVSPGAAPEATLLAYKVFGCEGSVDNSVIIAAIDRAVADGADVISMSLGATYGYADDPDAIAADNAVRAGVVVVVSAGNEGPMPYMVGGPSTGKRVISVAALDAVPQFPGALITLADGSAIEGINANGSTSGSFAGELFVLGGSADPEGCSPADYDGATGKIVVVQRGTCGRVEKAQYADAAGAIAAIMVNNGAGLPPYEGEVPGLDIPFIGVLESDGPALAAANTQSVTIDPAAILDNPQYRHPADFTSGGPRSGDSGQKPDLAAPGVSVQSAYVGSGTQAIGKSGTSMAAPHVSGIAALVVQAHPNWSPTLVKAALVSTADPSKVDGFDTRLAGNGLVNPAGAIATTVVVTGRSGETAVNFGLEELTGSYVEVQSIKLRNTGSSSVTYDLSTAWNSPAAGAVVSIWPSHVTVQAGHSRDVTVKVTISKTAAAAFPAAQYDGSLFTLQGQIVATPTAVSAATPVVRVPFLMAPHSRSNVQVVSKRVSRTSAGKAGTITVKNSGFVPGTADVYTWALGDARNRHSKADSRALGLQYFWDPAVEDMFIVFAFADYDRFANAGEQYQFMLVDIDGDDVEDAYVYVVDQGLWTGGVPDGQLITVVGDLNAQVEWLFGAAAAPDGSVVFGYAYASMFGITDSTGPATILYASTVSLADGAEDPFDGTATLSPFDPLTSQGDWLELAPRASANVPVQLRKPAAGEVPALGWMVVTIDDESGRAQADLINA